ncbi:40S ribosomal protein S12, mitochondrial [Fopius arisanus]|uniref:Small ribosomal subunit protein uS12m n=1 Tax=Fopius arisanus TaxID=64838 RepID=A0A0C9RD62_9HYME|nr:PREDICTED: 40S ribosomal protein S12, mitochondrial [Fopius arisanus]
MSVIARSLMNITRSYLANPLQGSISSLGRLCVNSTFTGFTEAKRFGSSLFRMHRTGPHIKKRTKPKPLNGQPFAKGVVIKTLIRKPKKPNSANRKCVLVKLSTGKEKIAYVPGEGHNLQEHNIVLCRVGRVKDCPGIKIKCVRGKYDLPHVVKKEN